jgi:hypothetical protein
MLPVRERLLLLAGLSAARRFLESYLAADKDAKPRFYRIVEDIVQECQVSPGVRDLDAHWLGRVSVNALRLL